jgi:hypothetical protein
MERRRAVIEHQSHHLGISGVLDRHNQRGFTRRAHVVGNDALVFVLAGRPAARLNLP